MLLKDAFNGHEVVFVGVKEMYRSDVVPHPFYAIRDVSRLHKWSIFPALAKLAFILLRERPDIVITTGSAPGMLALRLGKLFGARTVWIDSIANIEEMSLSGRRASRYADLWLTQWPHLSAENGPQYKGSVL